MWRDLVVAGAAGVAGAGLIVWALVASIEAGWLGL